MIEQSLVLLRVLQRARRRFAIQLVVNQAAFVLSIATAAFVVLLLLGTQVLEWYWLTPLIGGALLFSAYRIWRGVPSLYRLAQLLDNRLNLQDTLSTAYHFARGGKVRSEEVRRAQLENALAVIPAIDLRIALPHARPRSLYAVSGLAMLACGLFAVRYGVTQSLDLRPSLVRIALDRFLPEETSVLAAEKPVPLKKRFQNELEKLGIKLGSDDGDSNQYPAASDQNSVENGTPEGTATSKDGSKNQTASVDPNNPGVQGEPGAEAEKNAAASDQNGNDQAAPDQQPAGAQEASNQNAQKKGNQAGSQSPNLMDRMREAMASLLNKLKTQGQGSQTDQTSSKQSADGRQSPGKGQKGSPMPGKPQGNSQAQGDQQGQQEGQGDRSQMAQGKSGDKPANNQPSPDAKSGIGKEDGDKAAREAEQLAAMGKISEIIGKRSQNLSGDIMIEVPSNKEQQLRTAYTGKQGQHAEAGGEISRDEVPLVYQQYVQQYFEKVRKLPAKPKAAHAAGN